MMLGSKLYGKRLYVWLQACVAVRDTYDFEREGAAGFCTLGTEKSQTEMPLKTTG
jgi:hypothetical protein